MKSLIHFLCLRRHRSARCHLNTVEVEMCGNISSTLAQYTVNEHLVKKNRCKNICAVEESFDGCNCVSS